MVAVFLKAPVQGYMDSARRAEITDIADTALHRIERDLRTALPNSVRVTSNGSTVFLEYLETIAGGRYNSATTPADCLNNSALGGCTSLFTTGDLVTDSAGTLVNGQVINFSSTPPSAYLVVYNQYNNSGQDCSPTNPSVYCTPASGVAPVITGIINSGTADVINFGSSVFVPTGGSPYNRFQIVKQPVTYACTPGGTLTRYWGYTIQATQPNNTAGSPLFGASSAILATNIGSTCNFKYDAYVVAQQYGIVTLNLTVSEYNSNAGKFETVSLYSSTHVSNIP